MLIGALEPTHVFVAVAGAILPHHYSLHSLRQQLDRLLDRTQKVETRGNVPVAELAVQDHLLLRPKDVEWLKTREPLVAHKGTSTIALHQGAITVKSGHTTGIDALSMADQILVQSN